MRTFDRIRADEGDPGWRLRLQREPVFEELALLSEERVLPEHVNNLKAVTREGRTFDLTRDDAVWLRDSLNDLLAEWETHE